MQSVYRQQIDKKKISVGGEWTIDVCDRMPTLDVREAINQPLGFECEMC